MSTQNPLSVDDVNDIHHFLPGVHQEIKSMLETGCPHDRQRALKALRHLESMVTALKQKVEAYHRSELGPTLVVDNDRDH